VFPNNGFLPQISHAMAMFQLLQSGRISKTANPYAIRECFQSELL
jgi:hypothetical protein